MISAYDPTARSGARLSQKWKVLFHKERKVFVEDVSNVAISHRAVRLRVLQRMLTQAAFRVQAGLLRVEDLGDLVERAANGATLEIPLGTSLQAAEQALIQATLAAYGGNKKSTAKVLGISRRTLYLKLEHF